MHEAEANSAYDVVADVYADHFPATQPEEVIDLAMIDHFVALLAEPREVLDAGCGAGRLLPYLAHRGCLVQGIDASTGMIRRAQQDHPEFTTRVGNLNNLPYTDGAFDGVFSWHSTIHTSDDQLPQALAEMHRVTKRGGLVLVAFQVGEGAREVGQGFRRRGYDIELIRYYRTPPAMAAFLNAARIDVIARMERAAKDGEADGQAVLIGRTR